MKLFMMVLELVSLILKLVIALWAAWLAYGHLLHGEWPAAQAFILLLIYLGLPTKKRDA